MMVSRVLRIVLGLILVALLRSPAISAEDFVVMREISYASPDEVVHSYKFPGPLKSARVTPNSGGQGVQELNILFGNGKKVEIPAALLRCFKKARATESYLL